MARAACREVVYGNRKSMLLIVEFDRYIGVGDPEQTRKRRALLERSIQESADLSACILKICGA